MAFSNFHIQLLHIGTNSTLNVMEKEKKMEKKKRIQIGSFNKPANEPAHQPIRRYKITIYIYNFILLLHDIDTMAKFNEAFCIFRIHSHRFIFSNQWKCSFNIVYCLLFLTEFRICSMFNVWVNLKKRKS